MVSMLARESGPLLLGQPRSEGIKILLLSLDQAQNTHLATLAVSLGGSQNGFADNFLKGGGYHRLAQDLLAVYGKRLGASQAGAVRGPEKVLEAEHEVTRVHQEAREAAGGLVLCWGSEAAFLPFRGTGGRQDQSLPHCQTVSGHSGHSQGHWRSSYSKPSIRLLLRAQMPESCVCSGDKSHW